MGEKTHKVPPKAHTNKKYSKDFYWNFMITRKMVDQLYGQGMIPELLTNKLDTKETISR